MEPSRSEVFEPVRVERADTPVMFMRAEDTPEAITSAWAEFEELVGLKGRKFFGSFDPIAKEYRVCVQLRDGDDPETLGLEHATLPGGWYLRARLHGEPPALYQRIAPTWARLEKHAATDMSRPAIEFYRSRDVIDLLLSVA